MYLLDDSHGIEPRMGFGDLVWNRTLVVLGFDSESNPAFGFIFMESNPGCLGNGIEPCCLGISFTRNRTLVLFLHLTDMESNSDLFFGVAGFWTHMAACVPA